MLSFVPAFAVRVSNARAWSFIFQGGSITGSPGKLDSPEFLSALPVAVLARSVRSRNVTDRLTVIMRHDAQITINHICCHSHTLYADYSCSSPRSRSPGRIKLFANRNHKQTYRESKGQYFFGGIASYSIRRENKKRKRSHGSKIDRSHKKLW